MFIDTKGLVLREARYREADRIVTLYTESQGKITVSAHGALSKRSKIAAGTQSLTYSDFVLDYRKGRYSVREASTAEYFPGLRADLAKYSLACYFCEALDALSLEETPDNTLLRIALNALYALSNDLYPPEQIKAAYELKLISCLGFQPDIERCAECSAEEPDDPVFCIENGSVCCRGCHNSSMGFSVSISTEVLKALRYIIRSNVKNFISFKLSDEDIKSLSKACESFFLQHTDRGFSTLEYWKTVK